MPTLTPTAATGARSKPQEMTYVDPAGTMMPDEDEAFLANTGLNGPFVARPTQRHAGPRTLRRPALPLGGRPHQQPRPQAAVQELRQRDHRPRRHPRGPHRRARRRSRLHQPRGPRHGESRHRPSRVNLPPGWLGGAHNPGARLLDAVLLAEAKDHANWSCLAGMVDDLPDGDMREAFLAAVEEVEAQEDEHFRWAQDMRGRMISLQAASGPTSSLALKAEEMMARIKGLFD